VGIIIISAMHEELSAVLALMPHERKQVIAGREFWIGHLHGQEVVAVLSRIGKVAAATTATVAIEHFGATRIIFTGVAGGLAPGVKVGDIVVADSFLQHDLDASPLFPRYELPLYGLSRLPTDANLRSALHAAALKVLADSQALLGAAACSHFNLSSPAVHQGLVVSDDRFVCSGTQCQALRTALPDALAVEMEGAAIAQVCFDYGVPYAAVRTISDRADDLAHSDFAAFVHEVASRYSSAVLEHLFKSGRP
jgi:adenosylhomocysteine nucleosidase